MQRIQSFLLLIVIGALLLTNLVPIWIKENATYGYRISTWCFQELSFSGNTPHGDPVFCVYFPYALVGLLSLIAVVIATCELFRNKNRQQQMQLGMLNAMVMLGMLGLSLYLAFQKEAHSVSDEQGKYLLGFWLMIIAIVSNMLANHCIKKDELRVRAADRIR